MKLSIRVKKMGVKASNRNYLTNPIELFDTYAVE